MDLGRQMYVSEWDEEASVGLAPEIPIPPKPSASWRGFLWPIIITLVIILITHRIYVVWQRAKPPRKERGATSHLMIVLGSGGHTAEMLSMLRSIDCRRYTHRTHVISTGDDFSAGLAREFEAKLNKQEAEAGLPLSRGRIASVPRARKIHQSLYTAPWSCLLCLFVCINVLQMPWRALDQVEGADERTLEWVKATPEVGLPDAIITNGPATGVVVVIASYLHIFLGSEGASGRLRVIYVESWARVRRLSLSGRIMLKLADRFIVQWETLKRATVGKGEYGGVLVE